MGNGSYLQGLLFSKTIPFTYDLFKLKQSLLNIKCTLTLEIWTRKRSEIAACLHGAINMCITLYSHTARHPPSKESQLWTLIEMMSSFPNGAGCLFHCSACSIQRLWISQDSTNSSGDLSWAEKSARSPTYMHPACMVYRIQFKEIIQPRHWMFGLRNAPCHEFNVWLLMLS